MYNLRILSGWQVSNVIKIIFGDTHNDQNYSVVLYTLEEYLTINHKKLYCLSSLNVERASSTAL